MREIYGFLAIIFFFLLALIWITPAIAHDAPSGWSYDTSCCNTTDCRPADGAYGTREHSMLIREVAEGFLVTRPSGKSYPTDLVKWGDKRLRISKDGEYHVCTTSAGSDDGYVLCIYVPNRGF
jgi:hypothetical protein